MKITKQELDTLNGFDKPTLNWKSMKDTEKEINARTKFLNSLAKKYNFDPLTHGIDSETGDILILPSNVHTFQ